MQALCQQTKHTVEATTGFWGFSTIHLTPEGDEVGNEGGDEAHDEACDHVVASMLVVPLDVKKRAKATIRELPT